MKKKVLLSSIATIALCLCLIAGSTFALFTDSTNFNIAVTAGDVEIKSTAEVVQRWSAEGPVDAHSDKYLKDENGNYYKHEAQALEFSNGGTADVDADGTLVINRITPGDKVDVRINTENLSDVAFRFRYTVKVVKDNGLATGMVLTTHSGEEYEAVKSFTSEWFDVVAPGAGVPSKEFSIELPVYAGNEYQSEKTDQEDGRLAGEKYVEYQIVVEAVQGNAVVDGTATEVVIYATESSLQTALNNGGTIDGNGEIVTLVEALGFDSQDVKIVNTSLDGTNADAGDPTLAVYGYNGTLTLGEGATLTAGDYAIFAEKLTSITLEEGSKIVVADDSSVAIYSMTYNSDFTTDIYLNAQGLIVDENGAVATGAQFVLVTAGNYVFHVPTVEAFNEYSAMVSTDNLAKVTWYVNGELYMQDGVLVNN